MNNERTYQFSDNRESGKKAVFVAIRQNAPIARIDIAKQTGLSPATVTSITAEMITKGLIEEVTNPNQNAARRGRPRVDLQVRSDAHLVAGMKLTDKYATVVIVDFVGNRVAEFSNPSPAAFQPAEDTRDFLQETLLMALDDAGLTIKALSGVGIGLPGVIDTDTGLVRWSPTIMERDVPLQQMLHDVLGVAVFIENDANLVALAEQRFGLGTKARNFIVITIEQGVGMGIVIDGKIYRGTGGGGAELGHTKVHLDGALCRCGQRGCLEAYVGDYALLREASTTMGPLSGANPEQQMQLLMKEAQSGNQTALSIFQRAGRMFSMGLANVVNIFAPELIILSGERLQYDFLYDDDVIASMKQSIVQVAGPPPEVRVHKWGDRMWAMGAATYALEGVIDLELHG
ncbi:MAG: ROK family transcriptional regulator [Rhodobacteraceae bacterium]|nr:ROK family transcriptional regulator [Paracoccaceae bacterium]